MDFLFSGVVSAFALLLAAAGLVPFVLVALDWRNARFRKAYVDVLNGMTVLYLYFIVGLVLMALGGWVLAVQSAAANVAGVFMCVALVVGRYWNHLRQLRGMLKRSE